MRFLFFLSLTLAFPTEAMDLKAIVNQTIKAQCTKERAYELGFKQGKSDGKANSAFVDQCAAKAREVLKIAHRDGYNNGLKARPANTSHR